MGYITKSPLNLSHPFSILESEAVVTYKHFKVMLEKQAGKRIKRMRRGNGLETCFESLIGSARRKAL